jgi:4-hydroxybenzoate polyprenyltransferase
MCLDIISRKGSGRGPSYLLRRLIGALWVSARPAQLVKCGVAVGWGIYCSNGNRFGLEKASVFALVGAIVLYAGLYGLNDLTDLEFDRITTHKRFRPLPAVRIHSDQLLIASSIEIVCALILLATVGTAGLILGAALLLNQLVYSFEPFRWKRRLGLDVLSAAVLSHGLRFVLGFRGGTFGATTCLACAALIFWKIAAYLLYRLEDTPDYGVPKTDTAQVLGSRRAIATSAVTYAGSYGCFVAYAIRSRMPAFTFILFSLAFVAAVALYVRFRERGSVPASLNLLVFSSTAKKI